MVGARLPRSVVAVGGIVCAALWADVARAQDDDTLVAARKTFAEGVADQDAHRYEAALRAYRQVLAVKDTANVRYRIASCLESLGQRAEALAHYDAAVRLGAGDPSSADAAQVSRARAAELDRVLPHLTIVFSSPPLPDTQLRLDDVLTDLAVLREPFALDPGHHSIAATAPGAVPFHTSVELADGARLTLSVDLAAAPRPPPTAGGPPAGAATEPAEGSKAGPFIAFGVGGVLAAGAVVALVLRASNLATIDRDCLVLPNELWCPSSRASEVNNARRAAEIEGPLSLGLGVAAALAVGTGVWLLATGPSHQPNGHGGGGRAWVAPWLGGGGGGMRIGGVF